ncbi:MAG TPA: hypothetical protein VGO50_20145 [Pyrinomonadaceae bacterium]|jgi:hypothetical protein|nr:hypothetical protein [Pyrinomonadaceae bacterium]
MRRFAAGLSSFLFAVIFAVPTTAGSSACPVSPPIPLRGLYLKSDLVVVGKIGTPGKWKIQPRDENGGENFRYYNRTVPVQVEETIKGVAPRNLLVQEIQTKWVGQVEEEKPTPGIVKTPDEPELPSSLAENTDRRLFFLNQNTDDSASYQEAYMGRRFQPGQKDLPLFVSRLRELHAIYSAPVPSKQMIVEWIVTMAEEPATRYEGAYELRQALYNSGRVEESEDESGKDEQADTADPLDTAATADSGQENAVNTDAAQKTNESSAEETAGNTITAESLLLSMPVYRGLYQDYSDIAELLTPSQKERLIQSFLNTQFTYKVAEKSENDEDEDEDEDAQDGEEKGPPKIEYASVLNEDDELLLNAVGEFNDRRVATRLMAELPTVNKYGPRYAYTMIEILSAYFNDEKLEKLSDKYSDVYWGDENKLIDDEETADDDIASPAAPAADDKTPGDPPPDEEAAKEAKTIKKARQENYVPSKTYGQRRAELLAQVLVRCTELGERKARK